ncbi:MAG TPA: hypothetical protein PK696_07160 [bacterium]|nr:hypothetical protein [bacterium]HQM52460.1 hypothetical protein [bacterium]
MNHRLECISRNRYAILSAAVALLMFFHVSNRVWKGDFWEHAACVRELASRPLSPRHPMYLADTPHAFYSPYLLSVAVVSRVAGLGPIAGLTAAGIMNLILLLVSLRIFIGSCVEEEAEKTSFYTLLFILFLWGPPPWFWSGFLHMDVLGYVLPYPSTFSAALTFLSCAIYLRILRGARLTWFIPLYLTIPTVVLTHPTTALVLCAGLLAFTIGFRKTATRRILLLLAGAFAYSLLVVRLYPYYSFMDLLLGKGQVFHGDADDLYESLLPRTLPALIGIIPLLRRFRDDRLDPLVLFFAFLVGIYLCCGLSGSTGYGRVIFYIVLLLQMALATSVARAEAHKKAGVAALLLAYLYLTSPMLPMQGLRSVLQYMPGRGSNYSDLLFLSTRTKQDDVVLSDIETSLMVPALGGKVVAYDRPVYWVDNRARKQDAALFFDPATGEEERMRILQKYGVDYILLRTGGDSAARAAPYLFFPFGDQVYRNQAYSLIRVDEGKSVLSR